MSPRRKAFGRPAGPLFADLHLHSNQSDGTDPPAAVAARVAAAGLKAFALTDHDTTAGNAEAGEAAAGEGIDFLPGVEISAEFDRVEVHVLGLGLGDGSGKLEQRLQEVREERLARVEQIIEKLNGLGIPLAPAHVAEEAEGSTSPGRLHVARAMYRIGVTRNIQAAFTKFIGVGRPAYVPKKRMGFSEAVELIRGAGGLAVVAHPGIGGIEKKLTKMLALPLDGLEVWHPEHTVGQSEKFAVLARENGLLATGGSDDHGSKTERQFLGATGLNEEGFRALRDRLR